MLCFGSGLFQWNVFLNFMHNKNMTHFFSLRYNFKLYMTLSLAFCLSSDACLFTVNMAVGVNRRGTVSAVPVMEQDTLEPPVTLVSIPLCMHLFSFVFPLTWTLNYVPCVSVWYGFPLFAFEWLSRFLPPKPQWRDRWTFEVFRSRGFSLCVLCFCSGMSRGNQTKSTQRKKSQRERESFPFSFFFFEKLKNLRMPSLLPCATNIVLFKVRIRQKSFSSIVLLHR